MGILGAFDRIQSDVQDRSVLALPVFSIVYGEEVHDSRARDSRQLHTLTTHDDEGRNPDDIHADQVKEVFDGHNLHLLLHQNVNPFRYKGREGTVQRGLNASNPFVHGHRRVVGVPHWDLVMKFACATCHHHGQACLCEVTPGNVKVDGSRHPIVPACLPVSYNGTLGAWYGHAWVESELYPAVGRVVRVRMVVEPEQEGFGV